MADNQTKKRFENHKLRKFQPQDLIDERKSNEELALEGFFLVLASIFNDSKGIVRIWEWLGEYQTPPQDEVSDHAGEFIGIRTQLSRILVGMLHESLKFLDSHSELIHSESFKKYERDLSITDKRFWDVIVSTAENKGLESKDGDHAPMRKLLTQIRNNAAFHYYQSAQILIQGFRKFF